MLLYSLKKLKDALMIKNLIILALIVGVVYFVLRKFTVYRCPECTSIHVTKKTFYDVHGQKEAYICNKCGTIFTKEHVLKKGEE